MNIKTKFKNVVAKIENSNALPYVTGAMCGIAIMVFSYAGAKAGAREGLNGITYEFYFKSKEGETTKVDYPN